MVQDKELRIRLDLLESYLNEFSESTIDAYTDAIRDDDQDIFRDLLVGVVNNRDSDKAAKYILEFTKLEPVLYGKWSRYGKGPHYYAVAAELFYGLHDRRSIKLPDDIFDQTQLESRQAMAVMKLGSHLYYDYFQGSGLPDMIDKDEGTHDRGDIAFVTDHGLVRLALERPEDVNRIIDIIRKERVADPEQIRVMLDAPVQVLRAGAL